MKYLKVFTDFRYAMNELGEAERGRLISAMMEYAATGEIANLRGNEKALFMAAKVNIDAQRTAYEHQCEVNKANVNSRYESLRIDTSRKKNLRIVTNRYESKQDQDQYKKRNISNELFSSFWSSYPRKVGKLKAEQAWTRIAPDEELAAEIIESVELHKKTEGWRKDGGAFVPHPATFLNGRRWEDEVEPHQEETRYLNEEEGWNEL